MYSNYTNTKEVSLIYGIYSVGWRRITIVSQINDNWTLCPLACVRLTSKKRLKLCVTGPLRGESTSDEWISITKGPAMRKPFLFHDAFMYTWEGAGVLKSSRCWKALHITGWLPIQRWPVPGSTWILSGTACTGMICKQKHKNFVASPYMNTAG